MQAEVPAHAETAPDAPADISAEVSTTADEEEANKEDITTTDSNTTATNEEQLTGLGCYCHTTLLVSQNLQCTLNSMYLTYT